MIDTKEQSKKYAVCWENDCGYGTDYFDTPEERDTEMAEIQHTGTEAWPVDFVETERAYPRHALTLNT